MAAVSIIVPCYNSATYLAETLDSVLAQTFTDWQLIAVDDGSTDQTPEIMHDYAGRNPRIVAVYKPNGGVASARNFGFRAADRASRYLLFLDSDDLLHPEMLRRMVGYMDEHPAAALLFCNRCYIDQRGRPIRRDWVDTERWTPGRLLARRLPPSQPLTPFVTLFMDGMIVPSCALHRRDAYERSPGWDETIGQPYEDTDLHQRIALTNEVHYLPDKLVSYRVHDNQSTASERRMRAQRQRVLRKWADLMTTLPPDQAALIEQAWLFRRSLLAQRHLLWAIHELRRGRFVGAARETARSLRALQQGDFARPPGRLAIGGQLSTPIRHGDIT